MRALITPSDMSEPYTKVGSLPGRRVQGLVSGCREGCYSRVASCSAQRKERNNSTGYQGSGIEKGVGTC